MKMTYLMEYDICESLIGFCVNNLFFRIVKIFSTVVVVVNMHVNFLVQSDNKDNSGLDIFISVSLYIYIYIHTHTHTHTHTQSTCPTSQSRKGEKSVLNQKVSITFMLSSTTLLLQSGVLFSCYFRQTALTADAFLDAFQKLADATTNSKGLIIIS